MFEAIFGHDLQAGLLIVLNLILIESLLSVDNAAVLATMVSGLPSGQREKALKYGVLGAYVFRGLCLIFVSYLVQMDWIQALGGGYLVWLAFDFFQDRLPAGALICRIVKMCSIGAFVAIDHSQSLVSIGGFVFNIAVIVKIMLSVYALWIGIQLFQRLWHRELAKASPQEGYTIKSLLPVSGNSPNPFERLVGRFWYTVAMVEMVDLTFSIDNVFAAIAFTDKIGLICLGVFLGILAMRFAAQILVNLIGRFDFLEQIAFVVIGLLGAKLLVAYACDMHLLGQAFCRFESSHKFDFIVSLLTVGIFALPVLSSLWFNFPAQRSKTNA